MRAAQLSALCLALCAFACEGDDPQRDVVDLVNQTNDPSTVAGSDAASPSSSDDGNTTVPSSSGGNGGGGSRPLDASTSDAAPAQSPDAASSPYACEANGDCVVRDVGNCCGYYPRCANKNAIFSPPDCSGGQVGACGFPAIDSCTCRQNVCRSLAAGVEL